MAQLKVGDNPTTINPSAVLEVESTSKGLLPPRMTQTQRDAITSPANGLIIYCTDCLPKGVYVNDGSGASPIWTSLSSAATPQVAANCALNSFAGTYISGIALTGSNTFSTTITNNSFSTATISFGVGDLVLSGTTGVTVASVSPASATLSAGAAQLVTYTLSGTPATAGTLTGTWTKLSLNCTKTQTITLGASLTALNCSSGTTTGTITAGSAASGVSFSVPYTGGNGGAYLAQSISSTGVTGLTAALTAGTVATGAGNLNFTVSGTPSGAGTASFALTVGGQSCTYTIPVFSASSGGTGVVSAWSCATASAGTLQVGVAATGVTQTITATVTSAGTYNISIPAVNGITFSGSGTFAGTGAQNVILTASGTPAAGGSSSFTLPTTPNCNFTRTVLPAATFDCNNIAQTISPATPFVNNTVYTGGVTISYTAGNGTSYGAATLGPVSGLTLTRVAGTYAAGGGTVVYNLSGTYTGPNNGVVTFTGFSECPSASVVYGDAIRAALSQGGCGSCAAYDAAAADTWIGVDSATYSKVLLIPSAGQYGFTEAQVAPGSGATNVGPFVLSGSQTVGSSQTKVPSGSYPFACKILTGTNTTAIPGSALMLGTSNTVMNVFPTAKFLPGQVPSTTYFGPSNKFVFYVLKRPTTSVAANMLIGMYSAPGPGPTYQSTAIFIPTTGGTGFSTFYYVDNAFATNISANTSGGGNNWMMGIQVLATPTKQW
jgi:hypothetical protein